MYGEGTPRIQEWLQKRLHQLKHEGPRRLFTELRRLKTCPPEIKEIPANKIYLQKRAPQLQSPHFLVDGWAIGDGIVEIGNKLVAVVPAPKKPKDPKDNPWRKCKYGRALYQRDYSPQK